MMQKMICISVSTVVGFRFIERVIPNCNRVACTVFVYRLGKIVLLVCHMLDIFTNKYSYACAIYVLYACFVLVIIITTIYACIRYILIIFYTMLSFS